MSPETLSSATERPAGGSALPSAQGADADVRRLGLPGGYEVVRRLASGAFGVVYEARQLSTGQRVAVKILHPSGAGEGDDIARTGRFRREMQLCGGLSHPNIVRLIDSGEADDGGFYAVFEYVPGGTLREVLDAEGRLEIGEAAHLMSQVLDALSSAHAVGVVHRDLKPENIMLTRTGARRNALVLDFGLGGLVGGAAAHGGDPVDGAARSFLGTPAYAAPEQLRGDPPSPSSDLYSWGLVFIECLTGEPAMGRGSAADVIHRQLDAGMVPIPESVRGQPLGRLLQAVTAKRAVERDVTPEGLLHVLERLERASPVRAGELAPPPLGDVPGERRQVTVVSCRLSVQLGDPDVDVEEIDHVLHAQHAAIAEITAKGDGHLASAIADRVILLFGYSQASEDGARRAIRTTLDLMAAVARTNQRSAERGIRLDFAAGVHTGVVIARELRRGSAVDLLGVTPQVAAAIERRAGSGDVLVSSTTRALLRDTFGVAPVGELRPPESDRRLGVLRIEGPQRTLGTTPAAAEIPLAGRGREIEALEHALRDAMAGSPRSLLVLGEAGVGKSRVVRELRRRATSGGWLACRCTPEDRTSPLRPIVDLLASLREPLDELLARLGLDAATTLPLIESLTGRSATDSRDEPGMTPERQKELTLDALLRVLLRLGEIEPLVLVMEDLHWADATTLELVTRLVAQLEAARTASRSAEPVRLCVVLTGRSEFSPPWSPSSGSLVLLPRLDREDVRAMLANALGADAPAPAIVERIVERSDGIPLFVEEMARLVAEAARQVGEGQAGAAADVVIPATLRDLLTARLDAVREGARETAQLAAVLGREFRYEILRAVSARAELDLREDLDDLVAAGLVLPRHGARTENFVFRHALIRDAAYESIMRPARRRLHDRVVRTLRERFPELSRRRPELMALHHEGAGELEAAIESWQLAAESALRKAAFVESQQQAERGLALLDEMGRGERYDRLRLDLLNTLGTVQFNTLGLSAPAVEATFREAAVVAERIDGSRFSTKVLNGLWGVHFARGDREGVERLLPHMQDLAAQSDDPLGCLTGNTGIAIHAFWTGSFVRGRDHAARARVYYGHDDVRRFVRSYGWDGTMYCYSVEILCRWHLGEPDQARALCREMMEKVESERNPTTIAAALGFEAMLLRDLGEYETAIASSDRLIALAGEQKLYLWVAIGMLTRASASVGSGDAGAALPMLQQGLMILKTIGTLLSYAYYQGDLAEAHLLAGDLDAAGAAIDEGLELSSTLFARFFRPELYRLRARLLSRRGDAGAAEESALQAFALAREWQARSYELRAAIELAELQGGGPRRGEARERLAEVLGGFREGFATVDLRRARSVLATLSE